MNTGWNRITDSQQAQFLREACLDNLPSIAALNESQWRILTEIVGESTVAQMRGDADSLSSPALPAPKMTGDWSDIMMVVAQLRTKVGELQSNFFMEEVGIRKDNMAKASEERLEKLAESIKKMEKAAKSGLFGKIFGWIGAVIGLVGAAIATVATGGAAAPALAVAILGVTMMILEETGAMEKIVEFVAKNPMMLALILGPIGGAILGGVLTGLKEGGVLDEDKMKMAIQITFDAAMLVTSVAAMICSGGASASSAVFKVIGLVGQVAGGIASVGSGAAGVAQSAYSYQAADLQADAAEDRAWLAKLQAMLSEEMDRLQDIIDKLNQGFTDASDMLGDIADSNNAILKNLGM